MAELVLAPSLRFLRTNASKTQNTTEFLSEQDGFLPSKPLTQLEYPFSIWEDVAKRLPIIRRDKRWEEIDDLPLIEPTEENLKDKDVLRANMILGAIAHCQQHYGGRVSNNVMKAWLQIGKRLNRPQISFGSLDYFLYNVQKKQGASVVNRIPDVFDLYEPIVQPAGGLCEKNFILSCFSIEYNSRSLAGEVARAQDYILKKNIPKLMEQLSLILHSVEKATTSFLTSDPRPLCKSYVDQIEWGKSVGTVGLPVLPGEKTISGLLFPSIHLLDIFLGRTKYESEMGLLSVNDRKWLPKLHNKFYKKVGQISLSDFVEVNNIQPLTEMYNKIVTAYTSEEGLLGRHRLKIYGFLEASMKVGRTNTAAGNAKTNWRSRPWLQLNEQMKESMKERQTTTRNKYSDVYITERREIFKDNLYEVKLSLGKTGLTYHPGDRVCILPHNSDSVIEDTLSALEVCGNYLVKLNQEWEKYLHDIDIVAIKKGSESYLPLCVFLKYAEIHPLSTDVSVKMMKAMYNCHPVAITTVRNASRMEILGLLTLLKATSFVTLRHYLLPNLAKILPPLEPRSYSIASAPVLNKLHCPKDLWLTIQRVNYISKGFFRFEDSIKQAKNKQENVKVTSLSTNLILSNSETSVINLEKEIEEKRQEILLLPLEKQLIIQNACAILARKTSVKLSYIGRQILLYSKIVKVTGPKDHTIPRSISGSCSSLLISHPNHSIKVKIIAAPHFRLPNSSAPIIMFALGSGSGPFVSFVEHAFNTNRQGEMHLFWGVRNRLSLFKWEFWSKMIENKTLNCHLAFSQEDIEFKTLTENGNTTLQFTNGQRKRIIGLFDDSKLALLHDLLLKGAHIYLCGQPELSIVVTTIINTLLSNYCKQRNITQTDKVSKLSADSRYHVDLFYSGLYTEPDHYYQISEIAEHNKEDSIWVIFRDAVYDITEYLLVHPGGNKSLIDKAGRDFTKDFEAAHGAHNFRVVHMLKPYKIGSVKVFEGEPRVKTIYEWCKNTLFDILEFKSVFALNLNDFSAEPKEFVPFSREEGHLVFIHKKFIMINLNMLQEYFEEMFLSFQQIVEEDSNETLTVDKRFLIEIKQNLEHFQSIQGDLDEKKIKGLIEVDKVFHEDLVQLFVEMMKGIEDKEVEEEPLVVLDEVMNKLKELPKFWGKLFKNLK